MAEGNTTSENRWRRISELFDELLDVSDTERERVLSALAEQDAEVASEVRSLLAAHHSADGRFDKPLLSKYSAAQIDALAPPDAQLVGRRVGAYDVLRKIGEGGMGAVYEATRADATYEQRVAIKTIARGADSSIIATRFRRERQILAGLQHPNIALLLDGGISENGTPYFVMEYVDGLPLDQWCRTKKLSITERLDLMQQVCRGVQHAHQRLIVHRDLKPQNVFVSVDGVVKLLDFGIAKLIETTDGDGYTTVTRDGLTPMTAAYASPEQLRGEPVSTAGDVYSLGVMLYELLADVPPFAKAGRSPAQLANAVLTLTPPIPSEACTDEAANACGEPDRARLQKKLSGELDAIVMMAMRKEPERRYSSVEALAADIQRYLRGLPVAARADTLRYRVQRFAKRNRSAVGLASSLALLAAVSGVVILRQSGRARDEAARTARISEFLLGVLGAADARSLGGALPRMGPGATVGALLDSASQRVPIEFPNDPAVRARLYLTIGSSRITQSRMRDASEILDSAILLGRATYGELSDLVITASLEASEASLHRNLLTQSRAYAEAAQRALVQSKRTGDPLYARALCEFASIELVDNNFDAMERHATQALALETKRTSLPTMNKAVALNRLGTFAYLHSRYALADSLYSKSLATLDALGATSNLERLDVQNNRFGLLIGYGRVAEANSVLAQSERVAIETFGARSREHALLLATKSYLAMSRGDTVAAQSASDLAVDIVDSIPEMVASVRLGVQQSRATIFTSRNQWVPADSVYRIMVGELAGVKRGLVLVQTLVGYGVVLTRLGRYAEAEAVLRRGIEAYGASNIQVEYQISPYHAALADIYDRTGDSLGKAKELALLPANRLAYATAYIARARITDSIARVQTTRRANGGRAN